MVKEVGMKVDAFRNSKELVQIILDCVKGKFGCFRLHGEISITFLLV